MNTPTNTITFDAAFDSIQTELQYNPAWANGTGYYDNAVSGDDKVVVPAGEFAKSQAPMPNGRKLIFVGTVFGTIVVFARYTGAEGGMYVYNTNYHLDTVVVPVFERPLTNSNIEFLTNRRGATNAWLETISDVAKAYKV